MILWGRSSSGRASRSQREGGRFEPDRLHHLWIFGKTNYEYVRNIVKFVFMMTVLESILKENIS